MKAEANTLTKSAAGQPPMKLAIASKKDARFVEGRRSFVKYRDLGVTEATGGVMRAQMMSATQGLSKPTGWHYHLCEVQFIYMISGWVDIEFEDRGVVRVHAGDSVMIPGGLHHQETSTSDTFETLEISVPSDMGTKECDPPAA